MKGMTPQPVQCSLTESGLLEQLQTARDSHSGITDEQLKQHLLPLARAWLDGQRQQIADRYMETGDPAEYLSSHTEAVDTLLCALFELAQQGSYAPIALVAVGGYGRAELFPYSDLDLLFLFDAAEAHAAARIAEFILYILWDLGLKVGQSHRTVEETIALAKQDFTIRTNLLDARFLAGKDSIFTAMQEQFEREIRSGSALEFVEAKLAERDARHMRFGDSRYMLEPNVKEGKGGLRDLHTLWWMARYIYPIGDIKDLVGMNLLTEDEYKTFDNARRFLWRVRIYLHYLVDRAEERLTFDRQHALAVKMGFSHPSFNRSIERFMRRYFVAVRTVGSMTRVFCALLEEEKKRKPRKSLAWLWHMPWKLNGFFLDGERLNVRSEQAFDHNPILMVEIFKMANDHGLDIHPRAIQFMGRHLSRIDDVVRSDPKANALFMEILLGENAETTLRRMSEAGVLGRLIPDFGRIVGQTQFNMYHVFTVDEHTLVALGILHSIEKGAINKELPLATDIVQRIQMRRVLHLALFCHDIAKGRGGDHSELGEKIAARLAARFGFSPDEIETTAWLVRHHLLFSNTAFKRDIDDPKTIQDFVALVRTPERLKLLLILTAADIRAVGPTVWNAWKGALLRDLYKRAEQCMGTGEVELKKHHASQFRTDLLQRLAGWKEADIDAYLEQGNPSFWANFDLSRHAVIARMMKQAKSMSLPLLLDTHHTYEHSITEIIVCTYDQNGLFSKIAGAMALSGANIINAKIFTLKNGMVVDVFQVQDAMGQVFDRPDRLAKMSVYMEQALSDELDIAEAFRERQSQYINPSSIAVPLPGQVFIENDASNICSVIELSGQDRTGFLYDVTSAIAELGLSIATAHISTYGTQVADVFYVKDIFGMKITHRTKLMQVREALLRTINEAQ
jgi:[protein-PII] uridylyltransferase